MVLYILLQFALVTPLVVLVLCRTRNSSIHSVHEDSVHEDSVPSLITPEEAMRRRLLEDFPENEEEIEI